MILAFGQLKSRKLDTFQWSNSRLLRSWADTGSKAAHSPGTAKRASLLANGKGWNLGQLAGPGGCQQPSASPIDTQDVRDASQAKQKC